MEGRDYMGITREKIPWFPVIDVNKCINCGACLDFCSNDVFEVGDIVMIISNPCNCVVGCSSCQKICNSDAITFPSKNELINWINKLRNDP